MCNRFGDRACVTEEDSRTGRLRCERAASPVFAELLLSEYPWRGVQLPRDCLCSKLSEPLTFTFLPTSLVEVNFTVTFMNITQDFGSFHFEGEFQFLTAQSEASSDACLQLRAVRRLRGSSGELILRSPLAPKVTLNFVRFSYTRQIKYGQPTAKVLNSTPLPFKLLTSPTPVSFQ